MISRHIQRHSWRRNLGMPMPHMDGKKSGMPPADGNEMEMQCFSIVCWSYATLRLCDTELLGTIAEITVPRLSDLKPFELSNMIWAYAKLSLDVVHTSGLLDAVVQAVLKRQKGEFSMQSLSTIAWAFATVNR